MSPLTILDWNQAQREVQFVGCSRDFTAGFIRDEEGARRVVRLRLPHRYDIRFRQNPIAEANSPLLAITRTALHLPPCFATKEAAAITRTEGSLENFVVLASAPWKIISRHTSYLEPKDNRKLKQLLGREKARLRKLYDQHKQELAALPPDHEKRSALKAAFTAIQPGPAGQGYISVFDVTLDMVREGWGGLREKLLHDEWAKHHGLDLQRLQADARIFRSWLGRYAFNARHNTSTRLP